MTPGPSFTAPVTADSVLAEVDVSATETEAIVDPQPSASTQQLNLTNEANTMDTIDSSMHNGSNDGVRRSEPGLSQPKHCSRCGQQLDILPPTQPTLSRTPSSASMAAPSPSSYAFAPDSIRSQARLQPHQSLTSAINAAAAVALSRHLGTAETIVMDVDGNPICSHCASQAFGVTPPAGGIAFTAASSSRVPVSPSAHVAPASASSHTTNIQQEEESSSAQGPPILVARNSSSRVHALEDPNASGTEDAPSSSSGTSATAAQSIAPQAQLTISVDNMGAGGDAALTHSGEDVHMHDPSAFPPLERAPISPALRAPTSPPGFGRSTSRGRIRFAQAPTSNGENASQNAGPSTSFGLGRSSSFSRSLSYNAAESVSSSSAPVVVSFPPTHVSTPAPDPASLQNVQSTHIAASSAAPFAASSSAQSSQPQGRSRSGSQLHASGSTHSFVPAPAHAIPGGVKQRRPSSARRLSRTGSSTGPTTLPFAAVGTSASAAASAKAKDEDPYGPSAVTRPRLSLLPTYVIVDEIYNLARQTRPASLISSSTSTSLAASSSHHAAGIDPHRAVKYHVDPLSFSRANLANSDGDAAQQHEKEKTSSMDVDEERVSLGLSAKLGNARWFDPYKPDPLAELSRLRTPPKGRGCLYPGATFNGTQKSGRNSYDVTVRIVNVDLEASHLCGYLNIRGLTEDWPELTTYFDAEIIGDRYGFVTGKWGATEADDLKHWARFPPFRPLKSALSKPGLRFNHLNKPFVFMRWKEKFLVPDHRVRDINGASFAGFYYVCVELGESAGRPPVETRGRRDSNVSMGSANTLSPSASPTLPHTTATTTPAVSGPQWYAARTQRRRELSLSAPNQPHLVHAFHAQQQAANNGISYYHPIYHPHSPHGLAPSGPGFWPASPTSPHMGLGGGAEDPFANMWPDSLASREDGYDDMGAMGKMSGFYFHENSEPYQQLSLHHTPESSSSSFEMR